MAEDWKNITIAGCEGEIIETVSAMLSKKAKQIDYRDLAFFPWRKIRTLKIRCCDQRWEIGDLKKRAKLLPGVYYDENNADMLMVGVPIRKIQNYVNRCGAVLIRLDIQYTTMQEIRVSHLTGLKELRLSNNDGLRHVQGIEKLTELQSLNLKSTQMGPLLNLNPYHDLGKLDISESSICEILLDHPLMNMLSLYASDTQIQDGRFIRFFPELKCLDLQGSPVSALEGVEFPEKLVWLYLKDTALSHLPVGMRHLKGVHFFDISHLKLEELPDWFPELLLNNTVSMSGTTVQSMELGFLDQPQEVILQWFEEREKASDGAPLNEVKVVFLGDGEAGKSYTIARLLNEGSTPEDFNGDSTPGIVITDKDYKIGDRKVQVHFWDFGGQEILHSMHRMFLTERTLYVIFINARDDTQDDRARYWLHNVKSFANGAPVLLVLNKIDQNPNACVNETDLRAIYSGLTEVVRLSAMYDSPEKFNASFTESMKRQIGKMENLGFFFPASWTKAKQRLRDMTENYIRGSDYTAICDDCGVSNEGDFRMGLLNWFNDLGVSICYSGSRQLRDYVILRPNWITNAIYAILFNKHPDTKNGIISHKAIFEMIQPPEDGADPYRRTNSEEIYTEKEIEYILNVTRKFRLSFRVDDGIEEEREFIPMLCQRESLPIAAKYAADPDTLEFRMTFHYLPSNVLYRLMVELRQDLDTAQVWRTGAHFEQKSSGLSAVVKSEGNVLKFYVRSAGRTHKANTYLCILKDIVNQTVSSMNLEPPVNEVVYKLDGKCQAFDYDELVESLKYGETTRYSRAHKRRLFIDDILNQTGHGAEEEREKLFRDIQTICSQLQANRYYWDVKEDIRNTYLRDSLRNMGYEVADQTFSGIAGSGKGAGELDLEIRRGANTPWTICEALNIKDRSKANWNSHLQKLLDNYNPSGLPFLFLVSYVEGGADQFDSVWNVFADHVQHHSPDQYELRACQFYPVTFGSTEQIHYIQTAKCTYDRKGYPTTVYHIFVRMGA